MENTGLLLSMAEIAGIFVGFGALIAVRTGGVDDRHELAFMRAVVLQGMLTIVAALTPVALSQYNLSTHHVWAVSSVVLLAGEVVMVLAMLHTPEYRVGWTEEISLTRTRQRPLWLTAVDGTAYVLLVLSLVAFPVGIVLGIAPDLDAALYITVLVLVLLGAAWTLLALVLAPRRPTN